MVVNPVESASLLKVVVSDVNLHPYSKANRPLRHASLAALDALVSGHADALQDKDASALVTEAAALVGRCNGGAT